LAAQEQSLREEVRAGMIRNLGEGSDLKVHATRVDLFELWYREAHVVDGVHNKYIVLPERQYGPRVVLNGDVVLMESPS